MSFTKEQKKKAYLKLLELFNRKEKLPKPSMHCKIATKECFKKVISIAATRPDLNEQEKNYVLQSAIESAGDFVGRMLTPKRNAINFDGMVEHIKLVTRNFDRAPKHPREDDIKLAIKEYIAHTTPDCPKEQYPWIIKKIYPEMYALITYAALQGMSFSDSLRAALLSLRLNKIPMDGENPVVDKSITENISLN